MGFRDYYKQFDDIDEAALNLERRERRRREKEQALERLPDIDLSGTAPEDQEVTVVLNKALEAMKKAGAETIDVAVPGLDDLLRDSSLINAEFRFDFADYLAGDGHQ